MLRLSTCNSSASDGAHQRGGRGGGQEGGFRVGGEKCSTMPQTPSQIESLVVEPGGLCTFVREACGGIADGN